MAPRKPRHEKWNVAVVTGTRAEFGLLAPVMRAIEKHPALQLHVVAAGAHMLPPARTIRDVERDFDIAARVPMQRAGKTGRSADAIALGRGVEGFAKAFARLKPDWVVVLGDRIEAFAAASAASIAGIAVCHVHGGDRAEGIADEAMRHAITKLSHLHCAATKQSAQRIIRLGEPRAFVHVTGSPAIDGLRDVNPLSENELEALGRPTAVVLLHPAGLSPEQEEAFAKHTLVAASIPGGTWSEASIASGRRVLVLAPNNDPGRDVIMRFWQSKGARRLGAQLCEHLPRDQFLRLLKSLAVNQGVLLGNSSAGLIEASALGVRVIDVGPRQNGRERTDNVVHVPHATMPSFLRALSAFTRKKGPRVKHPYGDGRAGPRIAQLLAKFDPHEPAMLRKRIVY